MDLAAGLGTCPRCDGPAGGPFVHRQDVHACCDRCRVRWRTPLTTLEALQLNVARLYYEGVEA